MPCYIVVLPMEYKKSRHAASCRSAKRGKGPATRVPVATPAAGGLAQAQRRCLSPFFLLSHKSRGQAGQRMAASASPRVFYGRIKAGTGRATNGSKCQSPVFRNVQPAPTRLVTRIVFDSGTS